jgi:hypothetical protein
MFSSVKDNNVSQENIQEFLKLLQNNELPKEVATELFSHIKTDGMSNELIGNLLKSFKNNNGITLNSLQKDVLENQHHYSNFSISDISNFSSSLNMDTLKHVFSPEILSTLTQNSLFKLIPQSFYIPIGFFLFILFYKPFFLMIKIMYYTVKFFIKFVYSLFVFLLLMVINVLYLKKTYKIIKENFEDDTIKKNKKYFK